MQNTRCKCKTNQNKRCKLTAVSEFVGMSLCYIHARKLYNSQVSLIQRVYRGYLCRRKLRTIFYPLPDEIKDIILKHMREEYYINNYNRSINKILEKRVDNLFGNPYIYDNLYIYVEYLTTLNIDNLRNKILYYQDIIEIYNLYTKYIYITDEIYDSRLAELVSALWNTFIREADYGILDNNGEYMDLERKYYKLTYYKLKKTMMEYRKIYAKEYYHTIDKYNSVHRILY